MLAGTNTGTRRCRRQIVTPFMRCLSWQPGSRNSSSRTLATGHASRSRIIVGNRRGWPPSGDFPSCMRSGQIHGLPDGCAALRFDICETASPQHADQPLPTEQHQVPWRFQATPVPAPAPRATALDVRGIDEEHTTGFQQTMDGLYERQRFVQMLQHMTQRDRIEAARLAGVQLDGTHACIEAALPRGGDRLGIGSTPTTSHPASRALARKSPLPQPTSSSRCQSAVSANSETRHHVSAVATATSWPARHRTHWRAGAGFHSASSHSHWSAPASDTARRLVCQMRPAGRQRYACSRPRRRCRCSPRSAADRDTRCGNRYSDKASSGPGPRRTRCPPDPAAAIHAPYHCRPGTQARVPVRRRARVAATRAWISMPCLRWFPACPDLRVPAQAVEAADSATRRQHVPIASPHAAAIVHKSPGISPANAPARSPRRIRPLCESSR